MQKQLNQLIYLSTGDKSLMSVNQAINKPDQYMKEPESAEKAWMDY